MPTFISPPASDPALTAQTFTRNPTLFASLERIRAQRAAQAAQTVPNPQPQPETEAQFKQRLRAQRAARIERAFSRDRNLISGAENSGSDAAPEPPSPKLDVP